VKIVTSLPYDTSLFPISSVKVSAPPDEGLEESRQFRNKIRELNSYPVKSAALVAKVDVMSFRYSAATNELLACTCRIDRRCSFGTISLS
jgi:hypothetical protein